jgi:glycogen debranching enzyme
MEAKILPDMPEDVSTFHIQATESIQQRWPRTLKQGDTFALFDALGDCVSPGMTPGGVFHNDTRYLSDVLLLLDGQRPLLLSSTVENDNVVLTVDLSNPDIYQGNALILPRESFISGGPNSSGRAPVTNALPFAISTPVRKSAG